MFGIKTKKDKRIEALERQLNSMYLDMHLKHQINISKDATNGDVLKMLFPPSVYYGDDEKHMMLLTKNCELTCYNNEWWNAPYKGRK